MMNAPGTKIKAIIFGECVFVVFVSVVINTNVNILPLKSFNTVFNCKLEAECYIKNKFGKYNNEEYTLFVLVVHLFLKYR